MRTHRPDGGLHPEITVTHTQEWELYHNSLSLCSKKLRVCLAELRAAVRQSSHQPHRGGRLRERQPALPAVNPGGTVPVLVHNGHPVYESHDEIVMRHGTRASAAARCCRRILKRRPSSRRSVTALGPSLLPSSVRAVSQGGNSASTRPSGAARQRVRTSVGAALSRRDASRRSARCRCWPARAGCNSIEDYRPVRPSCACRSRSRSRCGNPRCSGSPNNRAPMAQARRTRSPGAGHGRAVDRKDLARVVGIRPTGSADAVKYTSCRSRLNSGTVSDVSVRWKPVTGGCYGRR